jgi:hypothetical protein
VRVFIDGVVVGNVPVNALGTFSLRVPAPLAVGAHEVTGKSILSDMSESSYSLPVVFTVRRESVLDFDGDGITDITGHIVQGNRVFYRSRLSASQTINTRMSNGRFPASADYDGDGRWDYGGVGVNQGMLRWSATLSGTGVVQEITFGRSGDTAVVGCRFGDRGAYAIAVMRGRTVRFRTWDGSSSGAFSVEASDLRSVLGCGDVDGDGIDEFIISNRDKESTERVTGVDRTGNRRYVKNVSRFMNGFIAREGVSGAPVLGALRGSGRDTKSSELRALRGTFEFPMLQLPSSLDVASGTFMREDGSSVVSGITWQRRGTLDVLRMLAYERNPKKVLKLLRGYRVTKPQDSKRVAGVRGAR